MGFLAIAFSFSAFATEITLTGGTFNDGPFKGTSVSAFKVDDNEVTLTEWNTATTNATTQGFTDLSTPTAGGANFPVENITWYDAVKWCNLKSLEAGLSPVYRTSSNATYKTGEIIPEVLSSANGYRLPTEVEWRWAAIGGTSQSTFAYSGSDVANTVAWSRTNSPTGAKTVKTLAANTKSIYDMSGNVFEWCFDEVPGVVGRRVLGGGWVVNSDSCQISIRGYSAPTRKELGFGFRIYRNN